MLDHDAVVHHDPDAGSLGASGCFPVDDSMLHPEVRESKPDHLVHDRREKLRQAEHIYNIGPTGQSGETRGTLFSKNLCDRGIYRIELIAVLLHVGRDVVAGLRRILRQPDDRDGAGMILRSMAEHVVYGLKTVHVVCADRQILLVPGSKQATEHNQLAEVISTVIRDKERFAQQILTISPAKRLEEV